MDSLLPGLGSVPAHPMFVHFPIALWSTGVVVLAVAVLRRHHDGFRIGRLLVEMGTAAAILTVVTGFFAADALGHDSPSHDRVHTHRNLMLAATSFGVVAVALGRLWKARTGHIAMLAALVIGCALTVIGADHGGYMVYGEGVGVSCPES